MAAAYVVGGPDLLRVGQKLVVDFPDTASLIVVLLVLVALSGGRSPRLPGYSHLSIQSYALAPLHACAPSNSSTSKRSGTPAAA